MLWEPAEQTHRNQEGKSFSTTMFLQCPLLTELNTFPTGKGEKNIKELSSFFPEQALKDGFGALRQ